MRSFLCGLFVVFCSLFASAQSNKGTITPVDSDDEAPQKPVLHYYDKHGERLETPVYYLAELDTVTSTRPSSPYPLINGFTVGVNFGDAVMSLIGQKHHSYDVSFMMSFHNWFFPVIEAGIGWGDHSENDGKLLIDAKPSFYGKIGLNYNFLYKSNPAYMAYLGLRFGFSSHRWDQTETRTQGEEGSETMVTEFSRLSCVSTYGEVLAGLKVKIVGPFSLGWNVRYRLGLHNSKKAEPWFVPGYGTGPLGVNICAYLTFGERPRRDLPKEPVAEDLPVADPDDDRSLPAGSTPDPRPSAVGGTSADAPSGAPAEGAAEASEGEAAKAPADSELKSSDAELK